MSGSARRVGSAYGTLPALGQLGGMDRKGACSEMVRQGLLKLDPRGHLPPGRALV